MIYGEGRNPLPFLITHPLNTIPLYFRGNGGKRGEGVFGVRDAWNLGTIGLKAQD